MHHVNAIAHADDLRQIRRDDDGAGSVLHELVDDGIDLVLGANIHAARRLVQNQNLGGM